MIEEKHIKELEEVLGMLESKLKEELKAVRSNRPSVDLVEDLALTAYDQLMSIKQVGSLSVVPPREIQVNVWDKSVVGAVMKAIENAKIGLSVTNDGTIVRATLPPLSSDRREELAKLVRKTGESFRIQVRTHRDEINKKLKAAEEEKEITEDGLFRAKEKIQKLVEAANDKIEKMVSDKIEQLND